MSEAIERCKEAKAASLVLRGASLAKRNGALLAMAEALRANTTRIVEANAMDMDAARSRGTKEGLLDRLLLTPQRIDSMAVALEEIARQEDPIGKVVEGRTLENGIHIDKVTVPLGVVAMIYEARPNVTSDAAGLCIKTGNAVVLRGGSMANKSNIALSHVLSEALVSVGLPAYGVRSIESTDRLETDELMGAVGLVDVLIPRGSASLISSCVAKAKVPVIETGVGNCHIYLQESAQLDMAIPIVINAKTQRTGVCNAAESLLVDSAAAQKLLPPVVSALQEAGVEMVGDELVRKICPDAAIAPATLQDWGTEYLDMKISIHVVDGYQKAVEHINTYGTGHSEAIITNDYRASEYFLNNVDAAAVYVNASTRFTDGEVFGLGAEIGISTQKLHARGPMGASVLTSTKYQCRGTGQIR